MLLLNLVLNGGNWRQSNTTLPNQISWFYFLRDYTIPLSWLIVYLQKMLPMSLNRELLDWCCPFLFKAAATAKGRVLMVMHSNGQNLLKLSLWNTRKPVLSATVQEYVVLFFCESNTFPKLFVFRLIYKCFCGFYWILKDYTPIFQKDVFSKFLLSCGLRDSGLDFFSPDRPQTTSTLMKTSANMS